MHPSRARATKARCCSPAACVSSPPGPMAPPHRRRGRSRACRPPAGRRTRRRGRGKQLEVERRHQPVVERLRRPEIRHVHAECPSTRRRPREHDDAAAVDRLLAHGLVAVVDRVERRCGSRSSSRRRGGLSRRAHSARQVGAEAVGADVGTLSPRPPRNIIMSRLSVTPRPTPMIVAVPPEPA